MYLVPSYFNLDNFAAALFLYYIKMENNMAVGSISFVCLCVFRACHKIVKRRKIFIDPWRIKRPESVHTARKLTFPCQPTQCT